jgi:hypothetical protein
MSMPKDTQGAAPEDVEAHAFRRSADESQAVEQRDSGEDVEAHGAQRPRPADGDSEGNDDVNEAPRWRA